MTNFRLSFKKKNKKFLSGQILSGNDIHMTKFSPVIKMMTKSDPTFLYNLRGMIKFYKTSNPQMHMIACKKKVLNVKKWSSYKAARKSGCAVQEIQRQKFILINSETSLWAWNCRDVSQGDIPNGKCWRNVPWEYWLWFVLLGIWPVLLISKVISNFK